MNTKRMRKWFRIRNTKQLRRHPVTRWSSLTAGFVTVAVQMIPVQLAAGTPYRIHVKPAWDAGLPRGWSAMTTPRQRQLIQQEQARAAKKPDVRELTEREMKMDRGRGYRNPDFGGTLPWARSCRDVDMCNGNLFKSFTDIQVANAKGAGLALQRTYNSDETRAGPFGMGWTHAYDIRNQDEVTGTVTNESLNYSDRADFFGAKHRYHRDADGLYSPPPYLFDELSSQYLYDLANGPIGVNNDIDVGMDGTTKHYIASITGTNVLNPERLCDYIQDRYGNQTNLAYTSVAWPDGTTHLLLSTVTDPSGRQLVYTWTNEGTSSQPAYRITQIQGPQYSVTYSYYTDPNHPESYQNLQSVTIDPGGLNRTTSYTYTSYAGQNGTEYGLLASITDPLGHTVSYTYTLASLTNTLWVQTVTEPASGGNLIWTFTASTGGPSPAVCNCGVASNDVMALTVNMDQYLRDVSTTQGQYFTFENSYDTANNQTQYLEPVYSATYPFTYNGIAVYQRGTVSTYGPHGNVLTQAPYGCTGMTTTTTYYNLSQYFQKASVTDANNNTTSFDVGDNQGNDPWGIQAASSGNKGSVLAVRDARYSTTGAQYVYQYNSYGQKSQETNLNGVVTNYTYGDAYGNLTQVVQDPGTGHLNRTTQMSYDVAGHVLQSTDPNGYQDNFTYNTAGQPLTASFPATANSSAETVSYTYDGNGRTTSVADNRGTTSIGYETGDDRVTSVTDPVTGTVSYTYGLGGYRTSMSLPGGGTWNYTYASTGSPNSAGTVLTKDDPNSATAWLRQITDDQGRICNYQLDIRGRWHETYWNEIYSGGNLKTECYTGQVEYEQSGGTGTPGWISHIENRYYSHPGGYHQGTYTVLTMNDYTYDPTGQRLSNELSNASGPIRTESYGYDQLNRLTSVNYGDGETQSYSFDNMGSRTQKVDSSTGTENSTYNAANMLLTRGTNSYTNDSNGNTLSGGSRTETWDSQNRLIGCTYSGNTCSYVYSADGFRHRAVVNGTATDCLLDQGMMLRERQSGSNFATYLAGPMGPQYRRDDVGGSIHWYAFDALGCVLGEVDQNGVLQASRTYDVYGIVRTSSGTSNSKHRFCGALGHPSEPETGLIYMRARYMDPATGTFVSEDPGKHGNG